MTGDKPVSAKDTNQCRRLIIDPNTKRLIHSIASLEYAPGKSVTAPCSEHGHVNDALGYLALGISRGLLP